MVGSAIIRRLEAEGFERLITRSSGELDLRDQLAVASFFAIERPDFVFLAAARVGGTSPTTAIRPTSSTITSRSP